MGLFERIKGIGPRPETVHVPDDTQIPPESFSGQSRRPPNLTSRMFRSKICPSPQGKRRSLCGTERMDNSRAYDFKVLVRQVRPQDKKLIFRQFI